MDVKRLVTVAVTSFSIIYGRIESLLPASIHLVCATAHNPPKEVQVMHRKNVALSESPLLHIHAIPFVISREGRRK